MLNTGYNTLIIRIILWWHWLLKNKTFKLGKILGLAVKILLVIAQNIAANITFAKISLWRNPVKWLKAHDNIDVFCARLFRLCWLIPRVLKPIIKIVGKMGRANSNNWRKPILAYWKSLFWRKQEGLILTNRKSLIWQMGQAC